MEQRRLGKYDIRATLGRGAMGVVYEGWDPVIARRVAIKTVRLPDDADIEATEMLARCKREAQAAGRLNHPNIVGVFDYGETDEFAYIVMEFIDGRTLKAVLDSGERLVPAEIVRVMTALLAGLQYSHDNGVVHRDIKPANIMLTGQGQVKIADFGIARIESSNMTQAGTVMGTPAYMSPEQFMGHTVDRRTDIYSAGVLLYQLVTGERPFDGSMSGIMHKALYVDPPRPSDLSVIAPAALDAVVAKAMAKRPENRFDSADSFARALRGAFDETATDPAGDAGATLVAAARPTPVAAFGVVLATGAAGTIGAVQRLFSGRIIAVCGLVLLAAVGATAWYLTGRHPTERQAEQRPPAGATVATAAVTRPTQAAPTNAPSIPPLPIPQSFVPAPAAPTAPPPPAVTTTAANAPLSTGPLVPMPPGLIGLADARALALGVPCALIDVSDTKSANIQSLMHVSGPIQPGEAFDAFRRQLRGPGRLVDVATDRLEAGQCPALEAVADRVRRSREGNPLRLITPEAPVAAGDRLTVTVRAVQAGAIYIDLYAVDGSVQHFPRRIVSPGGSGGDVTVTAPAPGPPGLRLLVAIAAPAPLNLPDRPATESGSAYLAVLRSELARSAPGVPEPRAEIAMVSIIAAPRPAVPPATPAATASARSRTPSLNAARCADIVGRVQLGEALSDADRSVLQTSCGR